MNRTWQEWLAGWDAQQTKYLPDREQRLGLLVGAVAALRGDRPVVLDLACGPGSITQRLLERLPGARVVGVDVDPALLAIAGGAFGDDPRVRLVRADLREPGWAERLPPGPYDAAVTATALHWLPEDALRRVYADLAALIRPGGIVANADHMPLPERFAGVADAVPLPLAPDDALDWEEWWDDAASDPTLGPLVAERRELFGGLSHPAEFTPAAEWHRRALIGGGFAEAEVIWRHGDDAVIAAIR